MRRPGGFVFRTSTDLSTEIAQSVAVSHPNHRRLVEQEANRSGRMIPAKGIWPDFDEGDARPAQQDHAPS